MCEPLRGKIKSRQYADLVVVDCFDKPDVKSAVDFYKKYRYKEPAFERDFPEVYKENYDLIECYAYFNDWLFNYCFGDVIDGI